ncbi:MAG: ATP-binding protein [Burkholderiales bacterium]|nr:ATP-binding protein [Burkholderiales bacterium]
MKTKNECYNTAIKQKEYIMKVDVQNASDLFFNGTSISLENMYFEAITNSIDAGANEISININIADIKNIASSLSMQISDNGNGFNDDNFERFCKLMSPADKNHKGIGRLVYLQYFNSIEIESDFNGKKRVFIFNKEFTTDKYTVSDNNHQINKTSLKFIDYRKSRIHDYNYLKPKFIKQRLLYHILPKLYEFRSDNKSLDITIKSNIPSGKNNRGLVTDIQTITINDIPKLEQIKFDIQLNNIIPNANNETTNEFTIKYSIDRNYYEKSNIYSMVILDKRAMNIDLVSLESLPKGFNFIIIIESEYYNNRSDNSRTSINYANLADEKIIKKAVLSELGKILHERYPTIKKKSEEITKTLENKFPHLIGLFNFDSIEMNLDNALTEAQDKFFNEQKKLLLNDKELTDTEYKKSLEVASRLLMEYVLYRNFTISRLESINKENSEEDIHNLICPMREICRKEDNADNLFRNNVWLLDDKFMTYSTAVSDKQIHHLYSEIDANNKNTDIQRPDIAIIFNRDPDKLQENEKVDVVIVELKKLGLNLYDTRQVIEDLKDRARRLIRNYGHKIQRVWFYGIVDMSAEFEHTLNEEKYIELFSGGKSFYKEEDILPIIGNKDYKVPIQLFITSLDTFIKDASMRNQTFLDIIKLNINNDMSKINN